ncbi:MAG: site-2 protease family protein [Oscillospiraceae bacterium]|nr:site-2 protease family protein [Oscillospiraceae bacterium]
MVTVLAAILCFGIIIMIHEFGHFIVAKKCGIRVLEFSIGMGPALISKKRGETLYSVRALPIGGYCAFEGEDTESKDPRAFRNASVPKRILVTVAGAFMNLVLGFVLILIVLCMDTKITTTTVDSFHTNELGLSAASSDAWLEPGDRFVSINGLKIYTATDISYALQNDDCEEFTVVVERGGKEITLENVRFRDQRIEDENVRVSFDFYVTGADKTIPNLASYTCRGFVSTARLIWISFRDLIRGKYGFNDMSSVVGIIDTTTEVVSQSKTLHDKVMTILDLMSFITINVGIFNLLPFPALDGARLLLLFVEGIRRKKLPANVEGSIHLAGFAILLVLMIALVFKDVVHIFNR